MPDEDSSRRPLPARRIVVALFATMTIVVLAFAFRGGEDTPTSTAVVAEGASNYRVRSGDTITSVADLHSISRDVLMEENDLTLSDSIDPGSRLTVPDPPTEGREPPPALLDATDKLTYAPTFARVSAEYDLPPGLLEALAWQQSKWVNAVIRDERTGIGQLRPDTADFLRRDVVDQPLDPTDPEDNIELAGAYLSHLLEVGDGDRAAALVGYRRGDETPAGGVWDLGTVSFVEQVLGLAPDFADPIAGPVPVTTTSTGG
jgi:hypothetical protein